ncbi:hypothetical protein EVAR_94117_1 [Eumeta japonica]|uniref:Uncharacterized protein n=1 Tax=Eumeta variegata TaxID=151549 RepID=A0A4C1U729_EUMVA|nr:hypothetical protein EVAR_94117_1 [Eumeta japonica]
MGKSTNEFSTLVKLNLPLRASESTLSYCSWMSIFALVTVASLLPTLDSTDVAFAVKRTSYEVVFIRRRPTIAGCSAVVDVDACTRSKTGSAKTDSEKEALLLHPFAEQAKIVLQYIIRKIPCIILLALMLLLPGDVMPENDVRRRRLCWPLDVETRRPTTQSAPSVVRFDCENDVRLYVPLPSNDRWP